MKIFHFQRFSIIQSKEVFRVGTDGVLLGAMANCTNCQSVLEIGTGTGLISLMLAQRNESIQILALDINPEAVNLANKNFKNSPFSKRLMAKNQDFKTFECKTKFDFIICNPPYFKKIKNSQKDILARQQIELNFEQLIEKSSQLLSEKGLFSVIIPKNSDNFFTQKCEEFGLKTERRINIKGNFQNEAKRCILEFCFNPQNYIEETLVLEKSPRVYTDEYLELTKDFHIFK